MMLAFFINKNGSGEIRGRQVADRLNRPICPDDYLNYSCLFVKQRPEDWWPSPCYLDIVDSKELFKDIKDNSNIIPIMFTQTGLGYAFRNGRKDAIYIPQHHCNFNNDTRQNNEIKTVGYLGSYRSFRLDVEQIEKELNEIGLDFIYIYAGRKRKRETTRERVVEFYKKIDIQIYFEYPIRFSNLNFKDHLKIVNAGSFRIPTICTSFRPDNNDTKDIYLHIDTQQELIQACKKIKDDKYLYDDISTKAYIHAQNYHIDKITPKYLELERIK